MISLAENVTVIPAKKKVGTQKLVSKVPLVRVAAYCRVSTDMDEQESSYEAQVEHYTAMIKSRSDWQFAGVYADDGISGTNTKKREEFNRMIKDCEAGKIDMVLTKSISRFSRNTVDCLKYTRRLKELNIAVFFEKENINTLDAKGEVLMTIMAALAQQESESLSQNVRLGIQFRNQQGKVQVNHNRFLGYTKDENGSLIIVPEEAEIVRRIYSEYLDGRSLIQIKRGLEADGIKNGAGNDMWWETNIKQILTNEKYIGDALLQKTYTVSVLDKKRSKNNGVLPKYYVESCHEPIISKEIFLKVQAEMVRRSNMGSGGKRRVYSSKYALSSAVCCGCCGDLYRRISWNNRGVRSTVWRCVDKVTNGRKSECTARTIKEELLQEVVVTAVNDAWQQKDTVISQLKANIEDVLGGGYREQIAGIEKRLKELQTELVSSVGNDAESDRIGNEIMQLREQREDALSASAQQSELKDRIDDLIAFLDEMPEMITEYDETLVRRLVERITVYDAKFIVEFKSGLEVEVEG